MAVSASEFLLSRARPIVRRSSKSLKTRAKRFGIGAASLKYSSAVRILAVGENLTTAFSPTAQMLAELITCCSAPAQYDLMAGGAWTGAGARYPGGICARLNHNMGADARLLKSFGEGIRFHGQQLRCKAVPDQKRAATEDRSGRRFR